jgi:hypothetical protein
MPDKLGFAGVAAAAVAVICCAAGPLLGTVAASLEVGALAGVAAGVAALLAGALLIVRRHRRSRDRTKASP